MGCLFVGSLISQQQASVSLGQICSDNFMCCHTQIEVADQTFYLTQSQYTDTGPTSPSADPIWPGARQGSHWSANFWVTGMTQPRKIPSQVGFEPRIFRSWGRRLNHQAHMGWSAHIHVCVCAYVCVRARVCVCVCVSVCVSMCGCGFSHCSRFICMCVSSPSIVYGWGKVEESLVVWFMRWKVYLYVCTLLQWFDSVLFLAVFACVCVCVCMCARPPMGWFPACVCVCVCVCVHACMPTHGLIPCMCVRACVPTHELIQCVCVCVCVCVRAHTGADPLHVRVYVCTWVCFHVMAFCCRTVSAGNSVAQQQGIHCKSRGHRIKPHFPHGAVFRSSHTNDSNIGVLVTAL